MNYIDGRPVTYAEYLRIAHDEAASPDGSNATDAVPPSALVGPVASSPRCKLRFTPFMTLQAAARIAGEHGLQLTVEWDGTHCRVTTSPQFPAEVPAFLRRQAD